jgi:beta-lactamase class A
VKRFAIAAVLLTAVATTAHADFREFQMVPVDPALEANLKDVAQQTLIQFKSDKFTPSDLAIAIVDVSSPSAPVRASYNGGLPFYPASVVKLFFMVEAFHQVHDRQLDMTPELRRALKEMIAVSDNDATAWILDVISDTCSGQELSGPALDRFIEKRGVANRYFKAMGYDISAMAKPWSFGPFGRDVQLMGPNRERRNRATADGVAALLLWIVRRKAASAASSDQMMALLRRPLPAGNDEDQVTEFIGESLPPGSGLWSKAGWTSEVRHDAAYIELPNGKKLVAVVFTRGIAGDKTLIPAIAKRILGLMQ